MVIKQVIIGYLSRNYNAVKYGKLAFVPVCRSLYCMYNQREIEREREREEREEREKKADREREEIVKRRDRERNSRKR